MWKMTSGFLRSAQEPAAFCFPKMMEGAACDGPVRACTLCYGAGGARAWLTVFGSHESWANSTPLSELLALDSIEPCSSMTVQTSAPFGARRRIGDWMAAVVDTASDMELRRTGWREPRVDRGKHADVFAGREINKAHILYYFYFVLLR